MTQELQHILGYVMIGLPYLVILILIFKIGGLKKALIMLGGFVIILVWLFLTTILLNA